MSPVLTNEQFDIAFSEWERNRMYPQYYEKGKSMNKPNQNHVDSIIRAQNQLELGVNVVGNPRLKKQLEKEIQHLSEVRIILTTMIDNPELPFAEHVLELGEKLLSLPYTKPEPVFDHIDDVPHDGI